MQYLDREFWDKSMAFWLFHVSSSCAWKAAPSALEEEHGREGWKAFEWCQPGVSRAWVPIPPSPAAEGKQGAHQAAWRPRWVWGEGKCGDCSKAECFSGLLLSLQQCRWVLLILCFSLLLWKAVPAGGYCPRFRPQRRYGYCSHSPNGRCPCCCALLPSLRASLSSWLCVSEEEGVPQERTKLISWEKVGAALSSLCSIGATFNSAVRQLWGPGWPAAAATPVVSGQAWGQQMQSVR